MWSNLTVKDIGKYRRPKLKKKGAKLDFRWDPLSTGSARLEALAAFGLMINKEELVISGFGEESFSGILSSMSTADLPRKKIERIKKWKQKFASTFSLFRIGKVQWIDDIHFE